MSIPTDQKPAIPRPARAGDPLLEIEPLVVKAKVARRLLGCGNTRLHELLGSGEIESYLDGRSRMVVLTSIKSYVAR
jgi:hypothetical protein